MKGAADQMTNMKQSVYMFPEGTRSLCGAHAAALSKRAPSTWAVQAQVPIVPVVAANYSHVLHPKDYVFESGKIPL
ncbi:hypothetical protein OPQ81_008057 [Rhizoctonia solani]|nr:hypothetical protein OPQ81_008057 [Rhizoctonia solani]